MSSIVDISLHSWYAKFTSYFQQVFCSNALKGKFRADNYPFDSKTSVYNLQVDKCGIGWLGIVWMDAITTAYTGNYVPNHRKEKRSFHQWNILAISAFEVRTPSLSNWMGKDYRIVDITDNFASFRIFCQHILVGNRNLEKKKMYLISFAKAIIKHHSEEDYKILPPDESSCLNLCFDIMERPGFPTFQQVHLEAYKAALSRYFEISRDKLTNPLPIKRKFVGSELSSYDDSNEIELREEDDDDGGESEEQIKKQFIVRQHHPLTISTAFDTSLPNDIAFTLLSLSKS